MFDFSFAEIALIGVVSVVFIGPKELPVVIRTVAKTIRGIKSLAHELHAAFDDLSRESGLKETAEEFNREIRMIKGDDGQMYESYELPHVRKAKPTAATPSLPIEKPEHAE